jgi:hypothetical protein
MRRRRIFALSGSSQLVPALAAGQLYGEGRSAAAFDDYLVLYGLNEPAHGLPFAQAITSLARRVNTWRRIEYFSKQDLRSLGRHSLATATDMVHQRIGINLADELYLNCAPHLCSGLLCAAYPQATGISYGDGIGVNYSPGYFRVPGRNALTRGWSRLRSLLGRFAGPSSFRGNQPRIDRYCLMLPNLFDVQTEQCDRSDPYVCHVLFQRLADALDSLLGPLADLQRAVRRASQVTICLPCNFSEAKRMTLHAECAAYREYLAPFAGDRNALLIVKPHPRDHPEKIARLQQVLSTSWRKVIFLSGTPLCYIPFEALYLRHFAPLGARLRLVAFSTACLAIRYLWGGQHCVGFGRELVERYFHPHWVESRLTHERHLLDALHKMPAPGGFHEHACTRLAG